MLWKFVTESLCKPWIWLQLQDPRIRYIGCWELWGHKCWMKSFNLHTYRMALYMCELMTRISNGRISWRHWYFTLSKTSAHFHHNQQCRKTSLLHHRMKCRITACLECIRCTHGLPEIMIIKGLILWTWAASIYRSIANIRNLFTNINRSHVPGFLVLWPFPTWSGSDLFDSVIDIEFPVNCDLSW